MLIFIEQNNTIYKLLIKQNKKKKINQSLTVLQKKETTMFNR